MKRTVKIKWGNLRIGIIVTFAIAALLYSSFHGGGTSIFEAKDSFYAYFTNVNGLVSGAPVWLAGVEVGNVQSVKFVNLDEKRRVLAEIKVKESVWPSLTVDSKVRLGTIGLLGDKYIEVIPGNPTLPVINSGDFLEVEEAMGLDAALTKAPELAESINDLSMSLKSVSDKLLSGEGLLGKLFTDTVLYEKLVTTLDQTSDVLARLHARQEKLLANLSGTLENMDTITAQIAAGEGSLGQMLYDDQLYASLSSSTAKLDSLLTRLDRGEGSAGALMKDEKLYEDVRDLVVRVQNLIADIEKNPKKYFKFSVF